MSIVWDIRRAGRRLFDLLLKLIPCKRIGEPEDIGQIAVWLAYDQSDYVHGATIYIDGRMPLYLGVIGAG